MDVMRRKTTTMSGRPIAFAPIAFAMTSVTGRFPVVTPPATGLLTVA
jgi:hypothetical protein